MREREVDGQLAIKNVKFLNFRRPSLEFDDSKSIQYQEAAKMSET